MDHILPAYIFSLPEKIFPHFFFSGTGEASK